MRLLAHNGEINTLLGNINWVKSRQQGANSDLNPGFDTQRLQGPLVDVGRSDSANLDRYRPPTLMLLIFICTYV